MVASYAFGMAVFIINAVTLTTSTVGAAGTLIGASLFTLGSIASRVGALAVRVRAGRRAVRRPL